MLLKNHFINDSRVLKEASSLINNGYLVSIFCLSDDLLPRIETINGIKVRRIQKISQKEKKILKKITALLLFSIKSILLCRRFQVVHCHDIETLHLGIIIKLLSFWRKKVIYDAHEYETDQSHSLDLSHRFKKNIYQMTERFFIQFVDHTICVSNSIANEYMKLYKIKKPSLILNCPPYYKKKYHKNLLRKHFNIEPDKIIFLYQGFLIRNRGIEILVEAFKRQGNPKKVIVFIGDGYLKEMIHTTSKEYDNIFHLNAVSPRNLLDYTSSANIGLLFYDNNCLNHYYGLQNKFFEYIQAELPIIISDLYETGLIIKRYNNGIIVKNDLEELVKVIDSITWRDIEEYRKNNDEIKKIYNWEQQEKALVNFYENLAQD